MVQFTLLRGEVASVDDQDAKLVESYAWHKHSEGYVVRTVGPRKHRQNIWLHRLVSGFEHPDHRDGNKLNNQRSNLREATVAENGANRKKTQKSRTTSQFKGVYFCRANKKWNKDRWVAKIKHKVKTKYQICLGAFSTEVEAAKAYNEAAKKLFGEFALLNPV